MERVHTHYDNLKVARDAPAEVIRAAYKSLSQKYHPDRHPGNATAAKVMAIINAAYEVLSDPDKRRAHDLWIQQQEREDAQFKELSSSSASQATKIPRIEDSASKLTRHATRFWPAYGIVGFFLWAYYSYEPSPPPSGPKPYQATPPMSVKPEQPKYVRPATAPNGQRWPMVAAYVPGYPRTNDSGLSTITIDNTRNDADVFVKLVSLDGDQAYPARQLFIPALGKFTIRKVSAGNYDIRYRDLDSGALLRSQQFDVDQIRGETSTQYSTIEISLYKVQDGTFHTYPLAEGEF